MKILFHLHLTTMDDAALDKIMGEEWSQYYKQSIYPNMSTIYSFFLEGRKENSESYLIFEFKQFEDIRNNVYPPKAIILAHLKATPKGCEGVVAGMQYLVDQAKGTTALPIMVQFPNGDNIFVCSLLCGWAPCK